MIRSTHSQAFLAVVLPLVITAVVMVGWVYHLLVEQQFQLLEQRADIIAVTVSDALTHEGALALARDDTARAEMALKDILSRYNDLASAVIFDRFGAQIAGMPDHMIHPSMRDGLHSDDFTSVEMRTAPVLTRYNDSLYVPLRERQAEVGLGTLRLRYEPQIVLRPAHTAFRHALMAGGVAIALAALATWFLFRNINRGFNEEVVVVVDAVMSGGDMQARVEANDAGPELRDSVNAINSLLSHVSNQSATCRAQTLDLEKMTRRVNTLVDERKENLYNWRLDKEELELQLNSLAKLVPFGAAVVDTHHRVLYANRRLGRIFGQETAEKPVMPNEFWEMVDNYVSMLTTDQRRMCLRFDEPESMRKRELQAHLEGLDETDRSVRRILVSVLDPNGVDVDMVSESHSLIRLLLHGIMPLYREAVMHTETALDSVHETAALRLLEGARLSQRQLGLLLDNVSAYADMFESDEPALRQYCDNVPDVLERVIRSIPREDGQAMPVVSHDPLLQSERIQVPERMLFLTASDIIVSLMTLYREGVIEMRSALNNAMLELRFSLIITPGSNDLLNSPTKQQVEALLDPVRDMMQLRSRLIRELAQRAGGSAVGPLTQHNRIDWTVSYPRKARRVAQEKEGGINDRIKDVFAGLFS